MGKSPRISSSNTPEFRLRYGMVISALLALLLIGILLIEDDRLTYKKIKYQRTFAQTLLLSKEEKKKCFVVFTVPHCYPCNNFLGHVENHPELSDYLARNYVSYKIDGKNSYTGGIELAEKYGVKEYPAAIITDPQGQLLTHLPILLNLQEGREMFVDLLGAFSKEPIPNKNMETTQISFRPKREFGLLYRTAENWTEALDVVRFLQKNWKEDIWIMPKPNGKYQVIIGRYDNPKMARLTRKFLKLWEEEHAKLVRLEPKSIRFFE